MKLAKEDPKKASCVNEIVNEKEQERLLHAVNVFKKNYKKQTLCVLETMCGYGRNIPAILDAFEV